MMMSEFLSEIETALNKGQIKKSIDLMRDWLLTARTGEPNELLSACSDSLRPKVALLMRDLLTRYPHTLLGCPVLMYATPSIELDSPHPPSLTLPFPSPDLAQPCSDLFFLGWIPASTQLPLALPFRPERHEHQVPWNTISVSIALFRSHPGVFDLESLDMPPMWWGSVFQSVSANIRIDGPMLLPYTDAIEAARVLQAAARGEVLPSKGSFLSDMGWGWALNAGVLFQETCRQALT